jgi:hypothetical protein
MTASQAVLFNPAGASLAAPIATSLASQHRRERLCRCVHAIFWLCVSAGFKQQQGTQGQCNQPMCLPATHQYESDTFLYVL